VQGFQESDQGRGLGGAEILSVSGHVAAALQDLAEQLIFSQTRSHHVERWTAQATLTAQRVAVSALLALEYHSARTFKRGAAGKKLLRDRRAAPGVHDRGPGTVETEPSERGE
jgi:hypothetical protein